MGERHINIEQERERAREGSNSWNMFQRTE